MNLNLRLERAHDGSITLRPSLGGTDSHLAGLVLGAVGKWTEADDTGIGFSSSGGFNLPDSSCLSASVAWLPLSEWDTLTTAEKARFAPRCPAFLIQVRALSDLREELEV